MHMGVSSALAEGVVDATAKEDTVCFQDIDLGTTMKVKIWDKGRMTRLFR
jgi:hypothetical protein